MKIAVFDVGGTFTKYAQSDENGTLTYKGKTKTPQTKELFHKMIQSILNEFDAVDGLAFSLPGFVDANRGYISLGGSLRYHDDCYFVSEMTEIFKLPVTIQNDAKCAALCEIWKGKANDYENAVVLVFGTGIGGALIQEGKVYKGSHYMSSELSCVINGDLSKQGFQAILGNQFSIPELMKRIANRLGREDIHGEEAFQLLHEQNQEVIEEMQIFYSKLAIQIFNFQCFYDPDVFLIGGGISEQQAFIEGIQQAISMFESRIPFKMPKINVESTSYKSDANLLGALYQFINSKEEKRNKV